jgi:hypothetical protein
MYEKFGFARQEDGSYEFRLFVPDSAVDRTQYVRGGPCRIVEVRVVGISRIRSRKAGGTGITTMAWS